MSQQKVKVYKKTSSMSFVCCNIEHLATHRKRLLMSYMTILIQGFRRDIDYLYKHIYSFILQNYIQIITKQKLTDRKGKFENMIRHWNFENWAESSENFSMQPQRTPIKKLKIQLFSFYLEKKGFLLPSLNFLGDVTAKPSEVRFIICYTLNIL